MRLVPGFHQDSIQAPPTLFEINGQEYLFVYWSVYVFSQDSGVYEHEVDHTSTWKSHTTVFNMPELLLKFIGVTREGKEYTWVFDKNYKVESWEKPDLTIDLLTPTYRIAFCPLKEKLLVAPTVREVNIVSPYDITAQRKRSPRW